MTKRKVKLIHPIAATDALNEYHNRVGMVLMTAHVASDLLKRHEEYKPIAERLDAAVAAVRECYGEGDEE